ncbi:type II secretion system F family protein [Paraburkholderia fungorum]|uniref:type II secretion system F family protein n=1 Tax=Paraburkholderia fungorum TaxID=134537 RepID=UPI0004865E90|nr:type II secretion system F family protein [Paraburkholderia fungorum]
MLNARIVKEALVVLGLRKGAPKDSATLLKHKRTGWWGKLSDAADRKAFNWKTREALYIHLSTQVENGVPVEVALDGFAEIMRKRNRRSSHALVENVSRRMREGLTLSRAIAIAVPKSEMGMIAAGEASGKLGLSLDLLVESHDRVEAVVRAYRGAAIRPIAYLAMMYGVMWAVGAYVMPTIVQGLPESKVQGAGIAMYIVADFTQSWLSVLPIIVACVVGYAVRWSLPRWVGPKRISAERYFPYSFYRDIEGFKWLSAFSGLLEAGVPDVHALSRQMETSTPWMRERLKHIRFRMMEGGMNLAQALEASGNKGKLPPFEFPNPEIIDRIRSIAAFKDFHEKVGRLTVRWSREIERNATTNAKKFGFYAEMTMYALMGFLMFSINGVTTQLGTFNGG